MAKNITVKLNWNLEGCPELSTEVEGRIVRACITHLDANLTNDQVKQIGIARLVFELSTRGYAVQIPGPGCDYMTIRAV